MRSRPGQTDRPATFVMPHLADHPMADRFLADAIAGLEAQSDERWQLVVVDDASPPSESLELLMQARDEHPERIHVIWMKSRRGPGVCRNVGVQWAAQQRSPLVLFHDADDVAHPERLAVTRTCLLSDGAECEFMYSPIIVIDEEGVEVPEDALPPSTSEIVDAHRDPPVGPRAWLEIGIRTGYATVTSTVSTTTSLAVRTPFPDVPFSEDSHTWLRMTAAGGGAHFEPSIPALYRIPGSSDAHRHRDRVGADCNRAKLEVDADGFLQALAIGLTNGSAAPEEAPELKRRFFERIARTMSQESEAELAERAQLLAGASVPEAIALGGLTSVGG